VLLVEDRQEENKRRGIVNVLVIVWRAGVIWCRPGRADFRVTEFGCNTADKKQKGTKHQRQVKRTGRRRINGTYFRVTEMPV